MQLTVKTHINAPIERVFAAIADIPNSAHMVTGIDKVEMISGGDQIGVGTKWKETRTMFGKEATEVMWITEFTPPASYTVEAQSNGTHYKSIVSFVEKDGGTEVSYTFMGTPVTLAAKLMSVVAFLFMGSMKNALQKDLEDLKQFIENE